MRGQPLTLTEREKIDILRRGKWKLRPIARTMNRDHSVIKREIDRNKDKDGVYRAANADRRAQERAHRPHRKKLDTHDQLRNWIVQHLQKGWSPEQISGRIKNRPDAQMIGSYVCHETIYQYIYEGEGRFLGLYQYLVRKHKKRQRKFGRKSRKQKGILFITPIAYRPEAINQKKEVGHWESDSIVSKQSKVALSVQRERVTRLTRITRVPNMTADETENAIRNQIEEFGPAVWKSITFDRGTEGANHWKLRMDYTLDTYQCDAYCSWQKGGVENENGLVRRVYPKGTDFSLITDYDIHVLQEKLNNQPRKCLGYKTPHEVWQELMGQEVVH